MVHLMLLRGARVDVVDDDGRTPLDVAAQNESFSHNHKFIADILRDYARNK